MAALEASCERPRKEKRMTVFVVGAGAVGKAVAGLAERVGHNVKLMDQEASRAPPEKCDVLHICFPYSSYFEFHCINYIIKFTPDLTIIESTVPAGTTRDIFLDLNPLYRIVHSPVRGRHDEIGSGLLRYPKFVGGFDFQSVSDVYDYYTSLGINDCRLCETPEDSEFAKLANLSYFAVQIAFFQELYRLAKLKGVDMKVVNEFIRSTGADRPIRYPGFIGGGCVMHGFWMLFNGTNLWSWVNGSNQKRKQEA